MHNGTDKLLEANLFPFLRQDFISVPFELIKLLKKAPAKTSPAPVVSQKSVSEIIAFSKISFPLIKALLPLSSFVITNIKPSFCEYSIKSIPLSFRIEASILFAKISFIHFDNFG